jgi:hypothetical protein
MNDLDTMLGRLRDQPVPAGLAAIDGKVLEELARLRRWPDLSGSMFALAASVAVVVGVVGSQVPSSTSEPRVVSPFDAHLALAPSTLLGSE